MVQVEGVQGSAVPPSGPSQSLHLSWLGGDICSIAITDGGGWGRSASNRAWKETGANVPVHNGRGRHEAMCRT